MTRRTVGATLAGIGVAAMATAAIGYVTTRHSSSPRALAGSSAVATPTAATTATGSPPAPTPESAAAFLRTFTAAFQTGDASTLFATLHPAVTGLYGDAQCRAFAATLHDPQVRFGFVAQSRPRVYHWTVDGHTTAVPDVTLVTVAVRHGTKLSTERIHLGLVNGTLRWFTDCGNPLLHSTG